MLVTCLAETETRFKETPKERNFLRISNSDVVGERGSVQYEAADLRARVAESKFEINAPFILATELAETVHELAMYPSLLRLGTAQD